MPKQEVNASHVQRIHPCPLFQEMQFKLVNTEGRDIDRHGRDFDRHILPPDFAAAGMLAAGPPEIHRAKRHKEGTPNDLNLWGWDV
jgi:hypothetical protein